MNLFMNGVEILRVENGKYYITDEEWECLKEVKRNEFIEDLKKLSWVCLTTWNKELRQQYLDLIEYVKEMK